MNTSFPIHAVRWQSIIFKLRIPPAVFAPTPQILDGGLETGFSISRILPVTAACACWLLAGQGFAQGFVNLDFELAKIIPIAPAANFVATSNALPGWTVFVFSINSPQSAIAYNYPEAGTVSLWATNGQQIAGNYSVLLHGGTTTPSASIAQTGEVPVSAVSLFFEAQAPTVGILQVSLGGQNIPVYAISTGPNYTLYGGDISAYAGRTEQLVFSALAAYRSSGWNIDNIQFSTQPIPEPGGLTLLGLGILLFSFFRLRNSCRQSAFVLNFPS